MCEQGYSVDGQRQHDVCCSASCHVVWWQPRPSPNCIACPCYPPQDFRLACLSQDTAAQLEVLERCKALPAFGAEHFAMAAAVARGCASGGAVTGSASPAGSLEVCRAAEAARLQRLTQQAPMDYAAVAAVSSAAVGLWLLLRLAVCCLAQSARPASALQTRQGEPVLLSCPPTGVSPPAHPPPDSQTLRVLLELSPSDADRLQLLGEAAGLLGAAPPGAYPAQVRWRCKPAVTGTLQSGLQSRL